MRQKTISRGGLVRLAADQGYAPAQTDLGYVYEHGLGVEHDFSEAARFYKLAAEQGQVEAQLDLGILYEAGRGVAGGGGRSERSRQPQQIG